MRSPRPVRIEKRKALIALRPSIHNQELEFVDLTIEPECVCSNLEVVDLTADDIEIEEARVSVTTPIVFDLTDDNDEELNSESQHQSSSVSPEETNFDIQKESEIQAEPNSENPGEPNSENPGEPNSENPGESNSENPGKPNFENLGEPNSENAGQENFEVQKSCNPGGSEEINFETLREVICESQQKSNSESQKSSLEIQHEANCEAREEFQIASLSSESLEEPFFDCPNASSEESFFDCQNELNFEGQSELFFESQNESNSANQEESISESNAEISSESKQDKTIEKSSLKHANGVSSDEVRVSAEFLSIDLISSSEQQGKLLEGSHGTILTNVHQEESGSGCQVDIDSAVTCPERDHENSSSGRQRDADNVSCTERNVVIATLIEARSVPVSLASDLILESEHEADNSCIVNEVTDVTNNFCNVEVDMYRPTEKIDVQSKKNLDCESASLNKSQNDQAIKPDEKPLNDEAIKPQERPSFSIPASPKPSYSIKMVIKKKEPKYFAKPSRKTSIFDRMRLKNIEDNQKFLEDINLNCESSVLAPKPPKIPKVKKVIEVRNEPKRVSGRERKESIPLQFSCVGTTSCPPRSKLSSVNLSHNFEQFSKVAQNLCNEPTEIGQPSDSSTERLLERLAKMKVQKVEISSLGQNKKLFDLNFYPGSSKILLATSDICGNVIFLNGDQNTQSVKIFKFKIQARAIRCVKFYPRNQSNLFTLGEDGVIKSVDLNKLEYDTVYLPNWNMNSARWKNLHHSFEFVRSESLICVGAPNGRVLLLDPRERFSKTAATIRHGMSTPVRFLSAHPSMPYLTTCNTNTVRVWDLRFMSNYRKIWLNTGSSTPMSVQYSPITGDRTLIACSDGWLRIYDSSQLSSANRQPIMKFKIAEHRDYLKYPEYYGIWHPRNETLFFGSRFEKSVLPNSIKLFATERRLSQTLRDVVGRLYQQNVTHKYFKHGPVLEVAGNDYSCFKYAFHPELDVLAGLQPCANVFLWK